MLSGHCQVVSYSWNILRLLEQRNQNKHLRTFQSIQAFGIKFKNVQGFCMNTNRVEWFVRTCGSNREERRAAYLPGDSQSRQVAVITVHRLNV